MITGVCFYRANYEEILVNVGMLSDTLCETDQSIALSVEIKGQSVEVVYKHRDGDIQKYIYSGIPYIAWGDEDAT